MLKPVNQKEEYMTPEQFVYWLQGYFEITNETELTSIQIKCIKDHLGKVFNRTDIKWIDNKWVAQEPLVVYQSIRSCGLSSFNDDPFTYINHINKN